MFDLSQTRSEMFLKMYRVLEGALEKRYSGRRQGSSVVMEYLRDEDSEPYRYQLNVCREIRNLLSHNSDEDGEPVVEPSEAILSSLQEIVDYVTKPRLAVDYGTLSDRILWAHANDPAIEIMHRMDRMGYSHVPILEGGKIIGVFSPGVLFAYLEECGLDSLRSNARIGQMRNQFDLSGRNASKFMFLPEDTTIVQARAAFETHRERNSRLSVIFITRTGTREEPLLAMLTPWDVLKDPASRN